MVLLAALFLSFAYFLHVTDAAWATRIEEIVAKGRTMAGSRRSFGKFIVDSCWIMTLKAPN
jgi:hypothetical protein